MPRIATIATALVQFCGMWFEHQMLRLQMCVRGMLHWEDRLVHA